MRTEPLVGRIATARMRVRVRMRSHLHANVFAVFVLGFVYEQDLVSWV